jgi:hypothetical protein
MTASKTRKAQRASNGKPVETRPSPAPQAEAQPAPTRSVAQLMSILTGPAIWMDRKEAVVEIGKRGSDAEHAIPVLLRAAIAPGEVQQVQKAIVGTIVTIGGRQASPALNAIAKSKALRPDVRAAATDGIAALRGTVAASQPQAQASSAPA